VCREYASFSSLVGISPSLLALCVVRASMLSMLLWPCQSPAQLKKAKCCLLVQLSL
jgi:hypothetical protein